MGAKIKSYKMIKPWSFFPKLKHIAKLNYGVKVPIMVNYYLLSSEGPAEKMLESIDEGRKCTEALSLDYSVQGQ